MSISLFCVAGFAIIACAIASAQRDEPLSVAERSGFTETSRFADVRAFLDTLAMRHPDVQVETFGTSEEGRALPLLAIPGSPGTRVPVVLVMANIHAGEVEGKEAVLHLARRILDGDLQSLRGAATWLLAPIYNADGNEKISLDHRTEQYGPIAGVGTRENAKGLDLNRDFMKLESAEAKALVALMTKWDPDVVVDLHTTNGSYHGYHLTYAPSLNPNTDARIIAFARDRLLATVREAMASRHRFRIYDYGNFAHVDALEEDELEGFAPDDARAKAWRTFDERPRFGNNYVGLRNRIAILSEAYSYLSFERRVRVTEAFVEEIMRFVAAHARDIRELTSSVDADWSRRASSTDAGVAFTLKALPTPVDVLVGAIGTTPNPNSGRPMRTMIEDVAVPTRMAVYDRFVATASRRVPREYVVQGSSALVDTVSRALAAHGIRTERAGATSRRSADVFVIDQVTHAARPFQGHRETSVTGRFERREIEIPSGSLVVRTDQKLGRLVFYLLEPESHDSLATWNLIDGDLASGKIHPVLKVF
jgi:hypothetical protein